MIKILCDRCGAEIRRGENIGTIRIRRRRFLGNVAEASGPNELDGKDYCSSCLDAVKDFLSGYQEEPGQPHPSKIDRGGQNQQ